MVKRTILDGYRKRTVYYDKALKFAPYAQCGVMVENNRIVFMSYSTPVIFIENNILTCTGTYSPTTRKQIGNFLREYAPNINYYDVKAIAGTEKGINILTKNAV